MPSRGHHPVHPSAGWDSPRTCAPAASAPTSGRCPPHGTSGGRPHTPSFSSSLAVLHRLHCQKNASPKTKHLSNDPPGAERGRGLGYARMIPPGACGLQKDMPVPPPASSLPALVRMPRASVCLLSTLQNHIVHLKKFLKTIDERSGPLVPWAPLAPACR